MSTWDDVKKKISDMEKDPFVDADMIRTMDTISIADYWRRRFEEDHSLSERKIGGKDEELHQLKSRLEGQGMELKMAHQALDSAHTEIVDKQRFWEERHHNLELENRGLKDRMEFEIRTKVLEEQNRFLAERLKRGRPAPEPEEAGEEAAPSRASRKELEEAKQAAAAAQLLRMQLETIQAEQKNWETERKRLTALSEEAESLRKAKAELEAKLEALQRESIPAREEMERLKAETQPLRNRIGYLKKSIDLREKEHLLALEDLGRGFAHRVRNYLGIMSGTLQLCLANYKMEAELQEQVALVDQNAQEMLKAIEEFLSLVRVPEMNWENVDMNGFLNRTLAALEDKAKAGNVKLIWTLTESLPPVQGEPRLLGEAVTSLAVNAFEAMAEGGKLTVETSYNAADHLVAVRFRDTGKGVNENHLRKVFQPYFTSKKGSKGLGLTVAKRVMELHRGSITLESVKGEGTTVTLSFPAAETE